MANVQLQPPQPDEQSNSCLNPAMGGHLAVNLNNSFEENNLPCDKYRQFMDSSVQERTFMIEKLVETFANVIDSIWHPKFFMEQQPATKVMPTRGFCNEILKRSKATYSTLQISLFYIFRVKKLVHNKLYQRMKSTSMQTSTDDLMCCGRRMFLASLMVASKYLHDKNYHNKAWAKITGLDIKEINHAEMAFLQLIDYRLFVSKPTFDKWYTQIHGHIQKSYNSTSSPISTTQSLTTTCNKPTLSNVPAINCKKMMPIDLNHNYPSPPLDEESNRQQQQQQQHPLAPFSPPPSYQRADSGISMLSSPNSTVSPSQMSVKRPFIDESLDSAAKRSCHH